MKLPKLYIQSWPENAIQDAKNGATYSLIACNENVTDEVDLIFLLSSYVLLHNSLGKENQIKQEQIILIFLYKVVVVDKKGEAENSVLLWRRYSLSVIPIENTLIFNRNFLLACHVNSGCISWKYGSKIPVKKEWQFIKYVQ